MKSKKLMHIAVTFAALAVTFQLAAQEPTKHHRYTLIDLGTFGGPQSYVYIPNNYATVLNNRGIVVGWADTEAQDPFSPNFCFNSDCYASPAFQSWNGTITDLSTLPGGASSAAGWISPNGLIAGWSQNGTTDPSFPGFPVTHGVLWKDGAMTDLDTLADGYESVALAVNSSGLVVGAADNSIADANPIYSDYYGWATQTRAFMWQNGVMKDLGTLGGTDAVALLVNERGQIAGISYTSSAPSAYCAADLGANLATGAFIYEDGKMKNLGSFGGTCTFANDLNDKGQIVGLSTLKGDKFQHAFLWENDSFRELPNTVGGKNSAAIQVNNDGVAVGWVSTSTGLLPQVAALWKDGEMKLLGSVDGDLCSDSYSINSKGQVVGVSAPACDYDQQRAFLWENGSLADLNTLIPAGSELYLNNPETINDLGEIAGTGLDSNGNQHAFVLIPCSSDDAACQNAPAGNGASRVSPPAYIHEPAAAAQDNPIRHLLRGQLGFRRFAAIPKNLTSNTTLTSGPNVTLAPTSLAFGTVAIGTTSAAKTVTLTNVGTTTLKINGIAIKGTNVGDFAQTHNCGSSLAAGASCRINVTFKPTATRTRTATLSVSDNAAGSPQSVSLSGTGVRGRCTPIGGQCPPQFPPCCPGLVCTPASTRAFCEPGSAQDGVTQPLYEPRNKSEDPTPILKDTLPGIKQPGTDPSKLQ